MPANTLYSIDVKSSSIDPNWPIMSPEKNNTTPQQSQKIHINPKFLQVNIFTFITLHVLYHIICRFLNQSLLSP